MSVLYRLWKDRMDIYRHEEYEENGVTKHKNMLKYPDVKCHYSQNNLAETGTDGVPTIISSHTLFCSLETDLKEGDKVIVTQRNGKKVSLSVGEGFSYSNHQEFKVKRDDVA